MLGSGWAAIPFIKGLSAEACQTKYDITVVSPRNYFLYSPLLPGPPPLIYVQFHQVFNIHLSTCTCRLASSPCARPCAEPRRDTKTPYTSQPPKT